MGLGLSIMFGGGGGGAGVAPPAAPTLSGLPDLSVQTGTGVTVNCAGYATGSGLIWTMTGPAELAINQLTGQITGTAGAAGTGTVTVTATNGGGSASDSFAMTVTAGSGVTVPGQVTGLTATAGDAQVSLLWVAPSNGGSAITDYLIEVNSGGGWSTVADGASAATSYTHSGLTNGTAYTYRVSAINAIGTGTASATAIATPASVSVTKIAGVPAHYKMSNVWSLGGTSSHNSRAEYMATGDLTSVTAIFGSRPQLDMQGTGVTMTFGAASLEYPEGVFHPITVSGASSWTLVPPAYATSDPISVSIPKGATYWIRTYFPIGMASIIYAANATGVGKMTLTTTIGDQTQVVGHSQYTFATGAYRPTAIGQGTNFDPVVVLVGDSIMAGQGEASWNLANSYGVVCRSLPWYTPIVNCSIGGTTGAMWWGGYDAGITLGPLMRYLATLGDHVISNYGTNLMYMTTVNRPVSDVQTHLATLWAREEFVGKTKTQLTIVPKTASTDGWTTEANQTPVRTGGMADVNAMILSNPWGLTRTIDIASALEGTDHSKFVAPSGTAMTADGVHPNTAGYQRVQDSGLISAALFGIA